jgi:hypothetical protein
MYPGNIINTHYIVRLHLCLDGLGVFYFREYIWRVLLHELMIRRLGSSKMDTDSKWLRAIVVYDALMGHVDVLRILHSWPSNTPDWRRNILTMVFKLAMAGSGWDLKRDTH